MSIRLIAAIVRPAAVAALLLSSPLAAQNTTPGSGGTQPAQPAPATPPVAAQPIPPATPGLNFSGVIFGSWNYQMATTPAQLRNQNNNEFVVDRAYLTFRMPAGDHTSIRITTDVFQTTENTPNAYTLRAKYAYLQYAADRMTNGVQLTGRLGILHNVIIDHQETFWPRWIS